MNQIGIRHCAIVTLFLGGMYLKEPILLSRTHLYFFIAVILSIAV